MSFGLLKKCFAGCDIIRKAGPMNVQKKYLESTQLFPLLFVLVVVSVQQGSFFARKSVFFQTRISQIFREQWVEILSKGYFWVLSLHFYEVIIY